jgi:Fuc2NAc and GlcNAc transferase
VILFFWTSAIAFVVSVIATRASIPASSRLGLVDRPNARSSHATVTPRGGGIGLLCGISGGLLAAHVVPDTAGWAIAAGTLLLAIVGAFDDRRGAAPVIRLIVHAVAAVLVIAVVGPMTRLPLPAPLNVPLGWLGVPLTFVWIVGTINIYNFLDGIDGFAGIQGAIAGTVIAACAWNNGAALAGVAAAAACAGFLVWNWQPARIFMGDSGSGALGFLFAALPLTAPADARSSAVFVTALGLWFFLADGALTVVRRLARGERVWEAHREHSYQRLVRSGWSHARVTGAIAACGAIVAALGTWWWMSRDPAAAWTASAAALALFAAEVWLAGGSAEPQRAHPTHHSVLPS